MDLIGVAASLLRGWYIVLVGLLVTGGAVYLASEVVPPTYEATATVLVLPPEASTEDVNPLLQLAGLDQPSSLVVAYLDGSSAREEFAERFPTAEYDVALDTLSHGPLITFTMHDPDETVVIEALRAVVDTVPTALETLQDRVAAPGSTRLTSTPLIVDVEPTVHLTDTLRALVAAAGVGIMLTLISAVCIDRLKSKRQVRRRDAEALTKSAKQEPAPEEAAQQDGPAPEEAAQQDGIRDVDRTSQVAWVSPHGPQVSSRR